MDNNVGTNAIPHNGTALSASLTIELGMLAAATKEALEACHKAEGPRNGVTWILTALDEVRNRLRAIDQMTSELLDIYEPESQTDADPVVFDASNVQLVSPEEWAEMEAEREERELRALPTPNNHCPVCLASAHV